MTALLTIAWLLCLAASLLAIYQTVGAHLMVTFFPEGKRWWMFPAQMASLAAFAAVVTFHPF